MDLTVDGIMDLIWTPLDRTYELAFFLRYSIVQFFIAYSLVLKVWVIQHRHQNFKT